MNPNQKATSKPPRLLLLTLPLLLSLQASLPLTFYLSHNSTYISSSFPRPSYMHSPLHTLLLTLPQLPSKTQHGWEKKP